MTDFELHGPWTGNAISDPYPMRSNSTRLLKGLMVWAIMAAVFAVPFMWGRL